MGLATHLTEPFMTRTPLTQIMRIVRRMVTSGAVMLCLAGGRDVALAQTNSLPPASTPATQPRIADRPAVISPVTTPERPGLPGRPDRPTVPERPTPAKDVKDLVKDFQAARQSFLQQQQELQRQLKTANDEQRAAIRAQLKENMQAWLEEQKSQMKDLREQAKEIRDNLPSIKEVIDSGHGDGRGR